MKENAIKALLCLGTFIVFVVLHTFYRMAGGNSSLIGAWIGNLLFLFPAISLPFYIWKKYPFDNSSKNEVNGLDSHVLQNNHKDIGANKLNPLLQSSKENNGGPAFGAYKSINDRFAQAQAFENNNRVQENNGTSDYQQKKKVLEELKKQGLLNSSEYYSKLEEITNDHNRKTQSSKIEKIKNDLLLSIDRAQEIGVLSKEIANKKREIVIISSYCSNCHHAEIHSFDICPKCGTETFKEKTKDLSPVNVSYFWSAAKSKANEHGPFTAQEIYQLYRDKKLLEAWYIRTKETDYDSDFKIADVITEFLLD